MFPAIAVIFLVALVLYAYTYHTREFEATASAIREIWSGNCRLSCRQSKPGELNELDKATSQTDELNRQTKDLTGHIEDSTQQTKDLTGQTEGLTFQTESDKPSTVKKICICETCPCALVENVLRTCKPATNVYNQSIEYVSRGYLLAVKAMCDVRKQYIEGEASETGRGKSNALSLKPAGSSDNFNFINKVAVKAETKEAEPIQKKGVAFRKQSIISEISKQLSKTTNSQGASVTKKSEERISTTDQNSCSKCIEKGEICMHDCPHDKENK